MKNALPKYHQIDHTADVGVKVYGANLPELFENAAFALFDIITKLERVQPDLELEVTVEASDREALLVNWLSELNYLFLTRNELYKNFQVKKISDKHLVATITGQKLDLDQHEIYTEVKAVTYHKLYIKETAQGCEAQVIFDL